MKKIIAVLILSVFCMGTPVFAVSKKLSNNIGTEQVEVPEIYSKGEVSKQSGETIKGSVSVDIKPYYNNWSTVQAYNKINNIGINLVDSNGIKKSVKFELSDSKSMNASTSLRNTITINRGLLKYVETEDELAFVIGHELGHAELNHVKKGFARKVAVASVGTAGAGSVVVGALKHSASATNAGLIVEGVALVAGIANKKLTRNDETAADLRSIDYMVNGGYNPMAAVSMLHKLGGGYFDFFSDHPSTDKRVIYSYDYILKKYPEYSNKELDTPAFRSAKNMISYSANKKTNKKKKTKVKNANFEYSLE